MNPFPKHIAFIMDGNRRWAKTHGYTLAHAYRAGGKKLGDIVDYFVQHDKHIELSFFAFSKENWKRPRPELDILFASMVNHFTDVTRRFTTGQVSFHFIGDRQGWPKNIRNLLESLENQYSQDCPVKVIVAVNYSGQWDLQQAIERSTLKGQTHRWQRFMQVAPYAEPDLLVRTGLHQRISNFYLYNLAYTELYFPRILWPNLTEHHLEEILHDYSATERNFGSSAKKILCQM